MVSEKKCNHPANGKKLLKALIPVLILIAVIKN